MAAQLPAYQIDNAMINFQPVTQALGNYQRGQQLAGTSTAQINAANAMQAGDFNTAAAETARSGDPATAMALRRHPIEVRALEGQERDREVRRLAGSLQPIVSMPDGPERVAAYTAWRDSNPRHLSAMQAAGLNPNDHMATPNSILSEALGPRDPGQQALTSAQTRLADAQGRLADAQALQGGRSETLTLYNAYVQQETGAGRTPRTLEQWDHARKQAGAQSITVDQRGPNAFNTRAGTVQADAMNEIWQGGNTSREMVADLNGLRDLAGQMQTGVPAEITRRLGPYAQALGVDIANLGHVQAYQAIVDRMAPRMRTPGSGATSDFDARQFLQSLPQLVNDPRGNQIITDTFQALSNHRIKAAEIAGRALANEITPAEAQRQIGALPDPWSAYREATGRAPTDTRRVNGPDNRGPAAGTQQSPVLVDTPEAALALPPGTFVRTPGPNGRLFQVPPR